MLLRFFSTPYKLIFEDHSAIFPLYLLLILLDRI